MIINTPYSVVSQEKIFFIPGMYINEYQVRIQFQSFAPTNQNPLTKSHRFCRVSNYFRSMYHAGTLCLGVMECDGEKRSCRHSARQGPEQQCPLPFGLAEAPHCDRG